MQWQFSIYNHGYAKLAMDCIYRSTSTSEDGSLHTHKCVVCGHERTTKYSDPKLIHRECTPDGYAKPVRPGERLTKLLDYIGAGETPGCGCKAMSVEMDRWGPDGCREHTGEILDKMREQAAERKLEFSERGARWLINLAIKLAEQHREPNTVERFVLDQAKKRIAKSLSCAQ